MSNNTFSKILTDGEQLVLIEGMGLTDLSIIPDTSNTVNDGTLLGENNSGAGTSEAIPIQTTINLSSNTAIRGWTITAPTSGKLNLIGQEK